MLKPNIVKKFTRRSWGTSRLLNKDLLSPKKRAEGMFVRSKNMSTEPLYENFWPTRCDIGSRIIIEAPIIAPQHPMASHLCTLFPAKNITGTSKAPCKFVRVKA
jgi:hypothetical protein